MQIWVTMLTVFCCDKEKGPADTYNDFNYQNKSTKIL